MKYAEGADPDEFSSDDSDDSLLEEEDIMLIEKALYEDDDDEIEVQNIAADPQKWELVCTLYGHKAAVTSVAFSNLGGTLSHASRRLVLAAILRGSHTTQVARTSQCTGVEWGRREEGTGARRSKAAMRGLSLASCPAIRRLLVHSAATCRHILVRIGAAGLGGEVNEVLRGLMWCVPTFNLQIGASPARRTAPSAPGPPISRPLALMRLV
jgi:hypothetical protein